MTCEELNLIIQKTSKTTSSFSTSLGRSAKYINVAIQQALTRGGHSTHNFAALVNQHYPRETRAVIGEERSKFLSKLPPIQKKGGSS